MRTAVDHVQARVEFCRRVGPFGDAGEGGQGFFCGDHYAITAMATRRPATRRVAAGRPVPPVEIEAAGRAADAAMLFFALVIISPYCTSPEPGVPPVG